MVGEELREPRGGGRGQRGEAEADGGDMGMGEPLNRTLSKEEKGYKFKN